LMMTILQKKWKELWWILTNSFQTQFIRSMNIMRILKRTKIRCSRESRKKIRRLTIKMTMFRLRWLRNSLLCTSYVFCGFCINYWSSVIQNEIHAVY
jgi:hypothetical protein